jgi:hypothetical protein
MFNDMSMHALDEIFTSFTKSKQTKKHLKNEIILNSQLNTNAKKQISDLSKDIKKLLFETKNLVQN